jgi:hypothetical protein
LDDGTRCCEVYLSCLFVRSSQFVQQGLGLPQGTQEPEHFDLQYDVSSSASSSTSSSSGVGVGVAGDDDGVDRDEPHGRVDKF